MQEVKAWLGTSQCLLLTLGSQSSERQGERQASRCAEKGAAFPHRAIP